MRDASGESVEFSPWLTLGKIYLVLSTISSSNSVSMFQIVTSDRDDAIHSLGYWPAVCFEVLTEYRPTSWRARTIGNTIELSPAAWQIDGFLEALYDGDKAAKLIFESERNLMILEEQ